VKEIKAKCFKNPKRKLWIGPTRDVPQVEIIFNLIEKLAYEDRPDYDEIHNQIVSIYNEFEMVQLYNTTPTG
jgi:hypothetical protein